MVVIGAISDKSKHESIKQLNQQAKGNSANVIVIRDAMVKEIHSDQLVPGDILFIESGSNIPVDGLLIQGDEIKSDESNLTGETDQMPKSTLECSIRVREELVRENSNVSFTKIPSPVILSGSSILQGEGMMVVLLVGDDSCLGRINLALDPQDEVLDQTKF